LKQRKEEKERKNLSKTDTFTGMDINGLVDISNIMPQKDPKGLEKGTKLNENGKQNGTNEEVKLQGSINENKGVKLNESGKQNVTLSEKREEIKESKENFQPVEDKPIVYNGEAFPTWQEFESLNSVEEEEIFIPTKKRVEPKTKMTPDQLEKAKQRKLAEVKRRQDMKQSILKRKNEVKNNSNEISGFPQPNIDMMLPNVNDGVRELDENKMSEEENKIDLSEVVKEEKISFKVENKTEPIPEEKDFLKERLQKENIKEKKIDGGLQENKKRNETLKDMMKEEVQKQMELDLGFVPGIVPDTLRNLEELARNPNSSSKYSSEGLQHIRNEMTKRFREFIEGYEPILLDFILDQQQSKYQDLLNQSESLNQENEEMSMKVEKLSEELQKSRKEVILYKSKAEMAEIQIETLEKKLEQTTQESLSLTKLCEELLTKLESI